MPFASAQNGFGSQVKVGDADYTPVARKDALSVTANEAIMDSGTAAVYDCVFVDAYTPAGIQYGDLHLNSCFDKAAGTLVDDTEAAARAASIPVAVSFVYSDVDGSNSYNKGDYVYATTTPGTLTLPGAPGTWSIRLTSNTGGLAGAIVLPGDPDMVAWRGQVKAVSMSLLQRDDKAFYLVPSAAPKCGVLDASAAATWATAPSASLKVCDEAGAAIYKNQPLPTGSIRLTGLTVAQPSIGPSQVTIANPEAWKAGDSVSVVVQVQNTGSAPGTGLLIARLGGRIVDARMTPVLSPGEKATVVESFRVPSDFGGSMEFAVNDYFTVVAVKSGSNPIPG
jgi:hypothetical protein